MINFKIPQERCNRRIETVRQMDRSMGFTHEETDLVLLCKGFLGAMREHFPNIYYVEIAEGDRPTGVSFTEFSSDTPLYTDEQKMNQFLTFSEGWHKILINRKDMANFRKRIHNFLNVEGLFERTILENYKNEKVELEEIIFQYGLMHVFCHEYGHAVMGHNLAKKHGNLGLSSCESRALEYNADIFAVNQMCKSFFNDHEAEWMTYNPETEERRIFVNEIIEMTSLMNLAVYIFLDGFYERENLNCKEQATREKTHFAPFLRQCFNLQQFTGIWDKWFGLGKEVLDRFGMNALHHLEAYEWAVHGLDDLKQASFWFGITTTGMRLEAEVQECWNSMCDEMIPYVSESVELRKMDVLNVAKRRYETVE